MKSDDLKRVELRLQTAEGLLRRNISTTREVRDTGRWRQDTASVSSKQLVPCENSVSSKQLVPCEDSVSSKPFVPCEDSVSSKQLVPCEDSVSSKQLVSCEDSVSSKQLVLSLMKSDDLKRVELRLQTADGLLRRNISTTREVAAGWGQVMTWKGDSLLAGFL
ncbi:hypothetical protein HF521_016875 [Silurus meridionalis]|uniref:Uncharacterized protein n=1 Tax=Silurus meridionalis TaxID=175797 RepID=A0A8T0BL63_SILME|nr:hypothetical protein HF521_016875 [Silurus meridionalis]